MKTSKVNKLYRLRKGYGGGANTNTISIEPLQTMESMVFIGKVREKAISIFGKGASLNTVGTSLGVFLRYKNESTNRKIARLLIKSVEIDEQLKSFISVKEI